MLQQTELVKLDRIDWVSMQIIDDIVTFGNQLNSSEISDKNRERVKKALKEILRQTKYYVHDVAD